MATITRFEDLEIWKEARLLVKEVYEVTGGGRFAKDFEMRNQMRAAALSTMNNSAEGFERGSNREFIHFLNIVRGSGGEVRSLCYAALDQNDIEQSDFNRIYKRADRVSRLSARLIGYLEKRTRETGVRTRNIPLAPTPTT